MKRFSLFLIAAALLAAAPACAERKMDDQSIAVLRMIDKLSARSSTFEVPVEKTVKFGSRLFIKVRACRKASPLDTPENAAFLQIWEKPPGVDDSKWIFSGWMFSSRPSASAMDHPVYDVWVIDCKNAATAAAPLTSESAPAVAPVADKAAPAAKPATDAGEKPAEAATKPETAPVANPAEQPEDSEAAPGPDDDSGTAATPPPEDQQPATPAQKENGAVPAPKEDGAVLAPSPGPVLKPIPPDRKVDTPPASGAATPPAKVFDPAAIKRDLEDNAGGGVSDGEDAVAAPDDQEKSKPQ